MSEVTLYEHEWSDEDFSGRNHALLSKTVGGVSRKNWQAMWVDGLNLIAAKIGLIGASAISTTLLTIGTGSKSLVVLTAVAWPVGYILRLTDTTNPDNFMVAVVEAIDGTSIDITVVLTGGSGTHASWLVGNAAANGLVSSDGGMVTGDFVRSGPAATRRLFGISTADSLRTALVLTDDAESGDNAGSNVALEIYDDDGETLLSTPISIDRATGLMTLTGAHLASLSMSAPDLGDVSGTVDITRASAPALTATMTGDTTFDFSSLGAGHEYTRKFHIIQGGAGGFEPTWWVDGAATKVKLMTPEPNYAGQTPGIMTRITAEVWWDTLRVWQTEETA